MDCIQQPTRFCIVAELKWSTKTLLQIKAVLNDGHGHYLMVKKLNPPLQLLEFWKKHHSNEVLLGNLQKVSRMAMIPSIEYNNSSPWKCPTICFANN